MDFSIIIVNWNTRDQLKDCLASIIQQSRSSEYEIIVVDNASSDGSCQLIDLEFPQVYLIRNRGNQGFAKANNLGILQSRGRYVVLLNPDTVLLNDTLGEFIKVFDQYPNVGAIGAKLITPNNTLQRWARGNMFSLRTTINHYLFLSYVFPRSRYFPGLVDNQDYATTTEMGWVSGACLVIRKDVLDHVGLLEESLFMYSEDVELCHRIKKAGYRIIYAPSALVKHLGSEGMKKQTSEKVLDLPFVSRDAVFQRIYGTRGLFTFRLVVLIGTLLRLLVWFIYSSIKRNELTNNTHKLFARQLRVAYRLLKNNNQLEIEENYIEQ